MAIAEDQLSVGADIHQSDEAILVRKINRQHASRRIGPDVTANDRRTINAGARMNGEQALLSGGSQAGCPALAGFHFDFSDRAVGILANRVDILAKKQIAHRGIADDDKFVDRFRIDWEGFDGVGKVAGERAHQEFARMMCVVMNARHNIGAAEALWVFERSVGHQLAGFQVQQPQHDGGRPQVHCDAKQRTGAAIDFHAVDQNAITVARDRRIAAQTFDD